jgi:hypothetical protein
MSKQITFIAPELLPMDLRVLAFLAEHGPCAMEAIPSHLFAGEIPEDAPDLVDLGMVEHLGGVIAITALGRQTLARLVR